jgi:hypothetical protein
VKVLHDHDASLVEFVLPEKKRFAVRRNCETTKERTWLVQSHDRRGLAVSKIKVFNSAVRRKILVQEVDSVASQFAVAGPVRSAIIAVGKRGQHMGYAIWYFEDANLPLVLGYGFKGEVAAL